MPAPVSVTRSVACSSSAASVSVTQPPAGVNFNASLARFHAICFSSTISACTIAGCSGSVIAIVTCRASASCRVVAMESRSGAHLWARRLAVLGRQPRIIAAHRVTRYRLESRRAKNDANDAAAICEAACGPSKRFVPIKTVDQQALVAKVLIRPRCIRSEVGVGAISDDQWPSECGASRSSSKMAKNADGPLGWWVRPGTVSLGLQARIGAACWGAISDADPYSASRPRVGGRGSTSTNEVRLLWVVRRSSGRRSDLRKAVSERRTKIVRRSLNPEPRLTRESLVCNTQNCAVVAFIAEAVIRRKREWGQHWWLVPQRDC